MTKAVEKAWESLNRIKAMTKIGKIGYDAGREFATPHLKIINDRGKEVSKKYNRTYYPLRFSKLMR